MRGRRSSLARLCARARTFFARALVRSCGTSRRSDFSRWRKGGRHAATESERAAAGRDGTDDAVGVAEGEQTPVVERVVGGAAACHGHNTAAP